MKHMRHIKRIHNGIDRRTGRKINVRRNRNAGALPDTTGFQKIQSDAKQAKLDKQEKRQGYTASRGPCCKDAAAIKAKNEQLLGQLKLLSKDRTLKCVGNSWVTVPVVPRFFIAKNRSHMAHFRQYVKAMNLPYKF